MKYIITTLGASAIEKANLNVENYINQQYSYFDNLKQDLENKVNQLLNHFRNINQLNQFPAEIKSLVKLGINNNPNDFFCLSTLF